MLSLAGQAQLIKFVLFFIQAYWTCHFMLLEAVHKKIQTIFTRFLWKGNPDSKGGDKIGWPRVCVPKEEGDLNFKIQKIGINLNFYTISIELFVKTTPCVLNGSITRSSSTIIFGSCSSPQTFLGFGKRFSSYVL